MFREFTGWARRPLGQMDHRGRKGTASLEVRRGLCLSLHFPQGLGGLQLALQPSDFCATFPKWNTPSGLSDGMSREEELTHWREPK